MFTICLFMFWLHMVVLSKSRKLQFTNRVNLSVFILHLEKDYRHIISAIYRFHKINSSRHNIMAFKIRYYYANSQQRRYRIRHWIPMFIGTPCISIRLFQIITWVKKSKVFFFFLEMETSNRLVVGLKNDIAEILVEEKLLTVTQIKVNICEVKR